MVIEQQITGSVIAGIKELYGADVAEAQVQLQKQRKNSKDILLWLSFLSCVCPRNLRSRLLKNWANTW